MKSDDEKLKELFGEKEKPVFNKVIKKAKIFSIIRNIMLSLMIFIILGFVLLVCNARILNNIANEKEWKLRSWYDIAMPNTYMTDVRVDDRIMTGEIDYEEYRFLGGKPVSDGSYKEGYTYMPLINGNYGYLGDRLILNGDNEQEKVSYNKVGRRIMKFYHPSTKYDKYLNDLEDVDKIGSNKLAELSLSFDKAYSLVEVKAMLPKEVTLNWYWVDTFDEKDLTREFPVEKDKTAKINLVFEEDDVYGIKAIDRQGNKMDNPEGDFINTITVGSNRKNVSSIYKDLFNKLSDGKGEIRKENIKIIGVVVSGDTDSLKKLKNQNYIKAATLGATADKY